MEDQEDPLEIFKQGQEAILAAVEKIRLQLRDYSAVRPLLAELEEKLLTHLQIQTQKINPLLKKFFCSHRDLDKVFEFHDFDIKELKVTALDFFDKFSKGPNPVVTRNFPMDFLQFRQEVIARVHAEEDQILPLLEEYFSAK